MKHTGIYFKETKLIHQMIFPFSIHREILKLYTLACIFPLPVSDIYLSLEICSVEDTLFIVLVNT